MDRIIKFRGKPIKTNEWVYGNYIFIENDIFQHKIIESTSLILDIDIKTLGQFTGLYDKNGREIYEGDIVKINAHNYDYGFKQEEIGQIKFIDGSFGFYRKIDNIKYCFYDLPAEVAEREIDYYEVIGNIWDNLELFEEIGYKVEEK